MTQLTAAYTNMLADLTENTILVIGGFMEILLILAIIYVGHEIWLSITSRKVRNSKIGSNKRLEIISKMKPGREREAAKSQLKQDIDSGKLSDETSRTVRMTIDSGLI